MKYLYCSFVIAIVSALSTSAFAQDVENQPAKSVNDRAETASCGCCTQGGASQTSPVILALDLDKDGQISALEIRNAVQSLSALDSDGNGHLTREEMHAKSDFSRVHAPRKSNRSQLQLGMTTERYVETMLTKYDADKNGRIEKSEMPERVLLFLESIDSNNDEVLTKAELLNINNQLKINREREFAKKAAQTKGTVKVREIQKTDAAKRKNRGNRKK